MFQILTMVFITSFCFGKLILLYGVDITNPRTSTRFVDGYNKPLIDRSGYTLVPELSDEFGGTKLNLNKWRPHMKNWKGRGAEFTPSNVSVKDGCLLYTSPSPRDGLLSRMPSSA